MGKLLFVDLSAGEHREEPLREEDCRAFLGGYGLGAKILYERMPPKADPLGPENILGFVTGPFTGTPAISSGRFTVVGKSPLTGGWGDANSGGFWGPYLRFAGYDGVFFDGIAPRPTYLLIENGTASLHDASALWGLDTIETEDALKATHGDKCYVACIGPAGEACSLLSSIITDKGRAAARSGLGAVMGSKKLKAVVVKGDMPVPVADLPEAKRLRTKWAKALSGEGVFFRKFGTTMLTPVNTAAGDTPLKNWVGTYPDDYSDASLAAIDETAFMPERDKPYGCYQCHIRCGGHLKQKAGRAKVSHVPEYETIAMCGPLCQNDDLESIIRFNDICNVYGLDTISVGAAVAFAIECFQNGILTEEQTGMPLRFGDGHAVVALAQKIADREGIGALLADGVMRAAAAIGKGSEQYAVHAGGQEIPAHDPRCYPSLALVYRMDATPGHHNRGGSSWIMGMGFMEAPGGKYDYEHIGASHRQAAAMCHVMACAGNCLFAYTSTPTGYIPEFLSAITGEPYDVAACLRIGERIETLRHLFNLREGINPLELYFNPRPLGHPPVIAGITANVSLDEEVMLDDYLREMDWDRHTAMPSDAKLGELGLLELVRHCGAAAQQASTEDAPDQRAAGR
jgi:aldehyde:ferredoxin oxidoreductase